MKDPMTITITKINPWFNGRATNALLMLYLKDEYPNVWKERLEDLCSSIPWTRKKYVDPVINTYKDQAQSNDKCLWMFLTTFIPEEEVVMAGYDDPQLNHLKHLDHLFGVEMYKTWHEYTLLDWFDIFGLFRVKKRLKRCIEIIDEMEAIAVKYIYSRIGEWEKYMEEKKDEMDELLEKYREGPYITFH